MYRETRLIAGCAANVNQCQWVSSLRSEAAGYGSSRSSEWTRQQLQWIGQLYKKVKEATAFPV